MITIYIKTREDLYRLLKFRDKLNMPVKAFVWDDKKWREATEQDIDFLVKTT